MLRKFRSKKFELVNAAEFVASTDACIKVWPDIAPGQTTDRLTTELVATNAPLPMTEPKMRAPSPIIAPSPMNELRTRVRVQTVAPLRTTESSTTAV